MGGLNFLSVESEACQDRRSILDEELISPVQAIRWIALGALAVTEIVPRSWRACSPERLFAEKINMETRLAFAELAILERIKSGQMRCAFVQASMDSGAGERLTLSVLDPLELKGASILRDWQNNELTLLISRKGDTSTRELSGFLMFWHEVEEFRAEQTALHYNGKTSQNEEILRKKALISAREIVNYSENVNIGRKASGRPSEKIYARAVLRFAHILKTRGAASAKNEKLDVLALDLVAEFAKDGQTKLNERHARDEAKAIRDFVFPKSPCAK